MATPVGQAADAVLWYGQERLCDAAFSLELRRTDPVDGRCGIVCTATICVDTQHVSTVAALLRRHPAHVRLTFGQTAAVALTDGDLRWHVSSPASERARFP